MRFSLFLPAIAIGAGLHAQPTFQAADLTWSLGQTEGQYVTTYFAPGIPGPNMMVDATGITLIAGPTYQVLASAATPFGSSFPQATHAQVRSDMPDRYSYVRFGPTGMEFIGAAGPNELGNYTDPVKQLVFPLAYGTTWQDTFEFEGVQDGNVLTGTGTFTGAYDAWGTVILASGTYTQVARVRTVTEIHQVLGVYPAAFRIKQDDYYISGHAMPLVSAFIFYQDNGDGFEVFAQGGALAAYAGTGLGLAEADLDLLALLAPNPAHGQFTISLPGGPVPGMHAELLDATGRLVRTLQGNDLSIGDRLDVDVADLPAGIYLVRLTDAADRRQTLRVVVE